MIYANTRLRYQVSVYRTIGPLVVVHICIALLKRIATFLLPINRHVFFHFFDEAVLI